jgi:hypothetical protein
MRPILLLITILFSTAVFSQSKLPEIKANEAYKHIGELVIVHDSLYSASFFKDSIAVAQIGNPVDKHSLTAIFISNVKNIEPKKFLTMFQLSKISLKGIIILSNNKPLMMFYGTKNTWMDYHTK